MKLSRDKFRLLLLGCMLWLILFLFLFRLAQLQIVDGSDYLAQQQKGSSILQMIPAARGEIVDRNGSPLARNEACYSIVFDQALAPDNEALLNETILRLIGMMRENHETWFDALPLTTQEPYDFTEDQAEISRLKSKSYLDLNTYATAHDVLYWLRQRYHLEEYQPADARAVAGVRYAMEKKGYSVQVRYTFSENISLETAVRVRQASSSLPCVNVLETARRVYVDGELMPHIVGRVGAIFADELESYQAKGYARDDLIGKEGIERAFEDVLRGEDGVRRIERDADRNVIGIIEERAAQPGDTVVLTLDKEIQRVAAQALAAQIKWLNDPKNTREGEGREANAGAVAVIDLKNSALVAAVTYPSYNLETYSADYAKNAADPLYPFLNRAFSGIYAPGSCFKPTTAVAGLAAGVITPQSIVNCQRVYTFYPDYQPTCLSYHGNFTVVDALRHSCNVFFYDTGRQLSIEILNRTAHSLGLGVPTGIELSEATGIQSDPNTKNPGDVLQTAIGQLGNGYTPIQLANYTATLARNGERRRLTLIQSESSYYDWQKVLSKTVPAVEEVMDVPADIFQTVREGMVQASHDPRGTAYRYLGDYPIKVASKTGTPQTHEYPNSTFICYAPADDPQIAIAVVIEKGWHGYTGAPVARAILDAWFFPQGQGFEAQESQASSPASTPVAAPQGH